MDCRSRWCASFLLVFAGAKLMALLSLQVPLFWWRIVGGRRTGGGAWEELFESAGWRGVRLRQRCVYRLVLNKSHLRTSRRARKE